MKRIKVNQQASATSDGISVKDWHEVTELSLSIVNLGAQNSDCFEMDCVRIRLFEFLNELDVKYGEKPSLIATRADFVLSDKKAISLLSRALELSRDANDKENFLLVNISLLERFVSLCDSDKANDVLGAIHNILVENPTMSFLCDNKELRSLENAVARLGLIKSDRKNII